MHTFETPQAVRLRVEIPKGRVRVIAGDVAQTTVDLVPMRGDPVAAAWIAEAEVAERGDEIVVLVRKHGLAFFGIGGAIEATITVPAASDANIATGSGHTFIVDDGEGDAGPRPTETLLAALAGCTAMDIASLLVKKRQPFTGYRVEARGSQQEDYPQVYTWIELIHVVEGSRVDDVKVRRSIELSATKYCPISAMISAGPTEVHHRYRIVDNATNPAEIREGLVMITGPYAPLVAVRS